MMTDTPLVIAEPISTDAFAPYGDVLIAPKAFGRTYFDQGLVNARQGATASMSVAHIGEATSLPVTSIEMERHEFSSQSFIPMDVSRYLIVVAPHSTGGAADTGQARAFVVPGNIGITYGVNVWHNPITVLDRPGIFAIQMWLDGSATDEEFVKLDQPFRIGLSEAA